MTHRVRPRTAGLVLAAVALAAAWAQGPAEVDATHAALRLVRLDLAGPAVDVWLDEARTFPAAGPGPTPYVRVRAGAPDLVVASAPDDATHAALRLVRLDLAGPAVDVWLDEARTFPAAGPGPTPYVRVRAGAPDLVVAAAPDDADEAAGPPAEDPLGSPRLDPGAYATLLLLPPGDGAGTGRFVLLDDALDALPPAGHAALRLVHGRPDAGALALVARPAEDPSDAPPSFEPVDGTAEVHVARLDPLAASEPASLPAGEHVLWLVGPDGAVALPEPVRATLRGGTTYTLFALPAEADDATRPVLVVDATAPAPVDRTAP